MDVGCNVALFVVGSYVTVAETGLPPCFFLTVKVDVVIVAGFMASLKLTTTVVMGGTLFALVVGTVLATVGATVSTVQVRLAGVRSTLPAGSVAITSKTCRPFVRPV